jgi:hypothetical protein
MADVQKLQTVVVREDLVERSCGRYLPCSCLFETRTNQDRWEDSYSGSVVELKVDAERPKNNAKAVINRCDACSRKEHKAQDCPKRLIKQPAGKPEGDAKAVSKGPGEPEDTTPGPEEPAGSKSGLQESSGTKSGSPGGRQTRSRTDALLQKEETNVGKPKTPEDMPKGFQELPRIEQHQGIQGFRSEDFEECPALGGRKNTTSEYIKGPEEGPADDIEIVKEAVGGSEQPSS